MNPREELKALLDTLATERDELLVRAHLARLEAQDEWQQLEKRLAELREKAATAAQIGGETARELLAAAKLAGEEIQRGYERLRKNL